LSNFVRITAGAFGTSIVTTVWQDRAALHHAQLAEAINTGSSAATGALSGMQATGMSYEQALASVNRLIDQQAYMLAASDVFLASAAIFVMLIPLVWLARPTKAQAGGAGADAASAAH
jgi:DHA2 family multidrug resistance protein